MEEWILDTVHMTYLPGGILAFIADDQLYVLLVGLSEDQFLVDHYTVDGRLIEIPDSDQFQSRFICDLEIILQVIYQVPYIPLFIANAYLKTDG